MTGTFSSHHAFDLNCLMRAEETHCLFCVMQHVMASLLTCCCLTLSLFKVFFSGRKTQKTAIADKQRFTYVVDLEVTVLRKLQKSWFQLHEVLEHKFRCSDTFGGCFFENHIKVKFNHFLLVHCLTNQLWDKLHKVYLMLLGGLISLKKRTVWVRFWDEFVDLMWKAPKEFQNSCMWPDTSWYKNGIFF